VRRRSVARGSKPKLARLKAPAQSAGAVRARQVEVAAVLETAPAPGSTPGASIPRMATLARQERRCPSCTGYFPAEGTNWIHDARCPQTAMLYYAYDFKASDWVSPVYQCCPWRCPGTPMTYGVTHSWDCPFWNTTTATPF